jgi:hypothetical protein
VNSVQASDFNEIYWYFYSEETSRSCCGAIDIAVRRGVKKMSEILGKRETLRAKVGRDESSQVSRCMTFTAATRVELKIL